MIEFMAEIGSNFITSQGPDINRAYRLIGQAAEVGCTGVKFQYYKANDLWHPSMTKELEVAEKRELQFDWIPKLSKCAHLNGLLFGLSVFDEKLVDNVTEYVDYFKIASFEISKFKLIEKCYLTGKRLMLSMGQSSVTEIEGIIVDLPDTGFKHTIDILHCVSKYPTKPKECNLSIIRDNPFINGWSDHTKSYAVIYTAIGMGAKVIEFHLDLEDAKGVEFRHSWHPNMIELAIVRAKVMEESIGTSNWDEVIKSQDRQDKANPKTGLRGG